MKRQPNSVYLIGLCAALAFGLGSGVASAQDIAWDLVNSSSQNLTSYGTDAPVFTSPGDGFQKYTVGVSPSIPYAMVDDTNAGYPPDTIGVIDAATDFNEFFGICDTMNDDNSSPLSATWVFDISSGVDSLDLRIDLAAMGDFESDDSFVWTYQVDSGSPTTALTAVADEGGSLTYTMADGTTRTHDDPLVVNGVTLYNAFQTFSIPIPLGSQLTVVLTASTDGGSETYVVRNIIVRDSAVPLAPGQPIPTLSSTGVAAMILMLMGVGVLLVRRLY